MNPSGPLEIPGSLTLVEGGGGLRKFLVETPHSIAEVYLHGAHVTRFEKKGEPPLLFMSEASEFNPEKPIRGGIPVIFPWFGPREGLPAHGYARAVEWHAEETLLLPDGSVSLRFRLPRLWRFDVEYLVTVGEKLTLELIVSNTDDVAADFETCLHTYFQVSDIDSISLTGLSNSEFLDKLTGEYQIESGPELQISGEVDRVYHRTTETVEIHDPGYQRKIRVEKSGSNSTVVWNPWIEKSIRMPDFGDTEYLRMVCVESGNVGLDKITLPPGEKSSLKVVLSSEPSV